MNTSSSDEQWRRLALCAQTDPEVFFPELGGSAVSAKKVCARCEVRAKCLADALNNGESYGIWGGMSDNERTRLKRKWTRKHGRGTTNPPDRADTAVTAPANQTAS
ncbi:WhiB family transcriptional regulator [Nocardia sp. NPDC052566]|uniref:WhiB family transcriptional regulator n=1 Tax=Nocardia sp. NPDC052566 TaxID=3364330 RepID=UPI0037C9F9D8